jgi:hypothetical protein
MAWVKAGAVEEVSFDEAGLSELHAASVTTADAAQMTSPTEEYMRKGFTGVRLQPRVSRDVAEWSSGTRGLLLTFEVDS